MTIELKPDTLPPILSNAKLKGYEKPVLKLNSTICLPCGDVFISVDNVNHGQLLTQFIADRMLGTYNENEVFIKVCIEGKEYLSNKFKLAKEFFVTSYVDALTFEDADAYKQLLVICFADTEKHLDLILKQYRSKKISAEEVGKKSNVNMVVVTTEGIRKHLKIDRDFLKGRLSYGVLEFDSEPHATLNCNALWCKA